MTSIDIVVIVLCVVVVAAVAAAAVIRKIKGKPSGCADCAHCSGQCPSHPARDDAKGEGTPRKDEAMPSCNGRCAGCTACGHSRSDAHTEDSV